MADYAGPVILSYLNSKDNFVRGYAAWALGELGITEGFSGLEKLKSDTDTFTMYREGKLQEKTIGEIAQQAIKKLQS
jgi:HEAT repeat protein